MVAEKKLGNRKYNVGSEITRLVSGYEDEYAMIMIYQEQEVSVMKVYLKISSSLQHVAPSIFIRASVTKLGPS